MEPMHICPSVHDKCCTLADEVKIKHLIEKHTQPILERRVAIVMRSIGAILESSIELIKVHPDNMVLNYSIPREIPIKEKRCESTARNIPTYSENQAYYRYHNGVNKLIRKKSLDAFLKIGKYKPRGRRRRRRRKLRQTKNVKKSGHYKVQRSLRRRSSRRRKDKRKTHHYEHFSHHVVFKTQESTVSTKCYIREELMSRDFVIVNEEKVKYCIGLHDTFLDMNLKVFIQYLDSVKMSLAKMVSMKNTLYCSICDAHKQHFFREKEKEIVMSKHFCNKTLKSEKDFFMFMHVFLVEYLNQILQYLACFETDGHIFEFPFPTFMVKYTRRVKYVKSCLSSLDDKKNFYKNCYMICRQFSLTRFSSFFEGDFEMLKRVNVGLHSFMRKLRRGEKLQDESNRKFLERFGVKERGNKALLAEIAIPENVDGVLLEPFGAHSGITDKRFYFSDEDRNRVFGTTNTEKFSIFYDPKDKKDIVLMKKAKKAMADAKTKKKKLKAKLLIQKLKDKRKKTLKFVPPKKMKFLVPLKKMVYGANGMVDRLSTRKFKENLFEGFYPQRGHHKIDKIHWKFEKQKAHYLSTLKTLAKLKADAQKKAAEAAEAKKRLASAKAKAKETKKEDPKPRILSSKKSKKTEKKEEEKEKKEKKEEEKKEEQKKPIEKNPFEIMDTLNTKMGHKVYRDVVSSPNTHALRKVPKRPTEQFEESFYIEELNQIFEKVEEKSKVMEFFHEFEEEGLDPLYDLDHVNFRFNTTSLIEKRFAIGEKLDRNVVSQYMALSKDHIKEFNDELEDVKVDDFDDINSKLQEVKDLKLVRKELAKDGNSPMKIAKINAEIKRIEKAVAENEARRKIVDKAMKRRRHRQGHSDLNHNKHPDHHHHMDLYYNDTFAGIAHMFEMVFGS